MSQMPELVTKNRFSNCVAMKLHFNKVQEQKQLPLPCPSLKSSTSTPHQIDLSLTIDFSGEEEMEVPGGKILGMPGGIVTFGFRRGKLQLSLENCKMPLEKITLNALFKIHVEVETQEEKGNEQQVGISGSGVTAGAKTASKTVEKILKEERSQIQKTGGEENPAWVFEVKTKQLILEGGLTEIKLGTIQVVTNPCEVKAAFTVRDEDIRLTWGKVGWTMNVSRNKLALIERAIALKYIAAQLKPSLSEVSWHYD